MWRWCANLYLVDMYSPQVSATKVWRKRCLDITRIYFKITFFRFYSLDWWTQPPKEQQVPRLRRPDMPCHEDRESGKSRLCVRCQQAAELEERELKEMQEREKDSQKGKTEKKRNIRKRMIEKASTQQAKQLKS